MRRIHKSEYDAHKFDEWVVKKGFRLWKEFSGTDQYYALRDHIAIEEQECLSAYTEQPLNENIWHIDHFRKRELYPALTFSYDNLFVDNRNDNYGACYKDARKAAVGKNTFDGKDKIFDPLKEDLSQCVKFDIEGMMLPKDQLNKDVRHRVEETIRVFNLNHPMLVSQRSAVIMSVVNYKVGNLSEDIIRECLLSQGFPSVVEWAIHNL